MMSPAMSEILCHFRGERQRYDQLVERVLRSGVKFAAGSDMRWSYPGKTRDKRAWPRLSSLRAAGMPPLDVIRAITVNAAEALGWAGSHRSDRAREIRRPRGRCRIPVADITELERVRFVMKDGEVIRNELGQ